jgi:opacity protein-like surface antigen
MKARLISIATLVIFVIPAVCLAEPLRTGGYMSGFIGANAPNDTTVTTDDFITNKTSRDRIELDPGINIGMTGGYDFGYIRMEGELSYKHSEIKEIIDQSDNFHFRNVDGNTAALAVMFNSFVDLHNDSIVTPYFGGGAGFATLYISDTFGTDTRGGTVNRKKLYEFDFDSVFAYQVGGGVEIAVNRVLSLDLGYRYFGTTTAKFNKDLDLTNKLRLESHNAALGFRFKF